MLEASNSSPTHTRRVSIWSRRKRRVATRQERAVPCNDQPALLALAALSSSPNVGVVDPLHVRMWEARLIRVVAAGYVRRSRRWTDGETESPNVAKAMPFEKERASPLFDDIGHDAGLREWARVRRLSGCRAQRVEDRHRAAEIARVRIVLGDDQLCFRVFGDCLRRGGGRVLVRIHDDSE